jgi:preprotein translocase subunit Sec61beta
LKDLFFTGSLKRWLLTLLIVAVFAVNSRSQSVNEFQIKAVFIYNFTQFIQWPEKSFGPSQNEFVIGILGENMFGKFLEESVAGEKYGSRPIVVKYFSTPAEIGNCQILYVGAFPDVNKIVSNKPVLTIGEQKDFMDKGGLLRFYKEDNKVRIEINPAAASGVGLIISSKLLRLATIYDKK